MAAALPLVAAAAFGLAGCDKLGPITSLFEPSWTPVDTNGDKGALRFVGSSSDFRVHLPEHLRIERTEKRTLTKPGGAKEEQERQRTIQVVLARCRPASICDARPHSQDTREVVVEPRMLGDAMLEVTVVVDGKENMSDAFKIHVAGM